MSCDHPPYHTWVDFFMVPTAMLASRSNQACGLRLNKILILLTFAGVFYGMLSRVLSRVPINNINSRINQYPSRGKKSLTCCSPYRPYSGCYLYYRSRPQQGEVHAVQEEKAQHQPQARPFPLPLACSHLLAHGELLTAIGDNRSIVQQANVSLLVHQVLLLTAAEFRSSIVQLS